MHIVFSELSISPSEKNNPNSPLSQDENAKIGSNDQGLKTTSSHSDKRPATNNSQDTLSQKEETLSTQVDYKKNNAVALIIKRLNKNAKK